ncbi:MAG: hypothetical protein QNJ60_05330 [Xenococcaceae cyanobacterium MO_188.B19]|nr:hypothetical protein [Xenococcaceae cyanobacterium MO_188.B19]
MGLDIYFSVFNGKTGEESDIDVEGDKRGRYRYQKMLLAISETGCSGYPMTKISLEYLKKNYYYWQEKYNSKYDPLEYIEYGYKTLDDFIVFEYVYEKNHNFNEEVAWSLKSELQKLIEILGQYKQIYPETDYSWVLCEGLKKGFELALKTEGYVTMTISY